MKIKRIKVKVIDIILPFLILFIVSSCNQNEERVSRVNIQLIYPDTILINREFVNANFAQKFQNHIDNSKGDSIVVKIVADSNFYYLGFISFVKYLLYLNGIDYLIFSVKNSDIKIIKLNPTWEYGLYVAKRGETYYAADFMIPYKFFVEFVSLYWCQYKFIGEDINKRVIISPFIPEHEKIKLDSIILDLKSKVEFSNICEEYYWTK